MKVCAMSTLSAKSISALKISSEFVQMAQNTGQRESSLPCWTMQNDKVIKRAMIACENSGRSTLECFPEVRKTSPMPNGGVKDILDYELSRYACYLIVQNGDPRKEVIALGQTYFAIQTYRQEVAERFNQLDEDSRRLVVRGDIKQWNQLLAETARNAGVITAEEFAIFQNAGYMGLYGGMTVDDIHRRKGLAIGQKILDYMGSTELIANLFRISQTEEKLRKDQVSTSDAATAVHYAVGNEVRRQSERSTALCRRIFQHLKRALRS